MKRATLMVDKSKEVIEWVNFFGRNIAMRRKQLSWTQLQLGERVGVDMETISRLISESIVKSQVKPIFTYLISDFI